MPEAASFLPPLLISPVYLVFFSPLIQSFLNLLFLSASAEQVKGKNMISFAHSLVKLGGQQPARTHKHTTMIDERSCAKGVK